MTYPETNSKKSNTKDIKDDELEDSDPRGAGIPPVFIMKLLMVCISIAFYILLAIFSGLVLAGENYDLSILIEKNSLTTWFVIVLACFGCFLIVSVLYVLFGMFSSESTMEKYRIFYRRAGITFLGLLFIVLGVWFTLAVMNIGDARWMAIIAIFFAGLLSFSPLLSAWWIHDEVRLKNLLDAMSRVCATLTFIVGGCSFLILQLID